MPPVTGDKPELEQVTPELAQAWLEKMGANRSLNSAHVTRLAEDIRRGDWRQTFDPIRFNRKDELVDGQHRLAAIIQTGKPLDLWVVRGLEPRAMAVIDTGKARSVADALQIRGVRNSRKVAASSKLLHYYDLGRMASSGPAVSTAQIDRVIRAHPFIHEAVEAVAGQSAVQPHAPLAMVYCLAHEKHPKKADEWLAQVLEGENLRKGMPSFVLRNRMLSLRGGAGAAQQLRGPFMAAAIVLAWNAFLEGRRDFTADNLKWRAKASTAEEPFPTVK